jgi:hypothetical protein
MSIVLGWGAHTRQLQEDLHISQDVQWGPSPKIRATWADLVWRKHSWHSCGEVGWVERGWRRQWAVSSGYTVPHRDVKVFPRERGKIVKTKWKAAALFLGIEHYFHLEFFFFFVVLGFELRAYTLSHSINSFLVKGIFKIESRELFASAASNCNLPDLCLLSG